MAKYSFMWFRPIMFSQFYARFAGGVMQGFQLLDRFDHNSSEDLAEVPKLCTTSTALHYLALMSYYFYNSSVESLELCTTSTALRGTDVLLLLQLQRGVPQTMYYIHCTTWRGPPNYYLQCTALLGTTLLLLFYFIHPRTGHTWHRSTHFPIIHF